jgi:hypothetical protein
MKNRYRETADKKKFIENIFQGKRRFHQLQANLPIEEKIRILIKLQKISLDISEISKTKRVWNI